MRSKVKISLLIILLISACNKPPVPADKMVPLIVDIQLMEAANQVQYGMAKLPDDIWKSDYTFVCKKHQIDTATFSAAIKWYQAHPEKMSSVMDKVLAELQKIEIKNRIPKP